MERLITKAQAIDWPKVRLQEYFLVVNPDEAVGSKVIQEKENFNKQYGQNISIKSEPHITIARFEAREEMEGTIFRYMQRILSRQDTFDIALNNYSGLPPHSIYLRVQNPQRLTQLANELKAIENYIDSCLCPPVKLMKKPHVTIAKNLPETLYLKAMMNYSQKTFHEIFSVSELLLLRRSHEYDIAKVLNVFRLQPAENTLYN